MSNLLWGHIELIKEVEVWLVRRRAMLPRTSLVFKKAVNDLSIRTMSSSRAVGKLEDKVAIVTASTEG